MPYINKAPEYYLARLNDRQRRVALLLVQGVSNKAIAESLGISEIAVSKYKNSTLFKAYWRSLREKVEANVLSNERMVAELIPKVLELNHQLVNKALDGEMNDRDSINVAKHWTKPYVELPGEGSILSQDELKALQLRVQGNYFKKKPIEEAEVVAVCNTPEEVEDDASLSSTECIREALPNEEGDDCLLQPAQKAEELGNRGIIIES